jgi:hypothetical protein
VLVLLMGVIYEVYRSDDDRFSNSSNINGITSTTSEAVVLVLLMTGLS